jgi:hypothetical protein
MVVIRNSVVVIGLSCGVSPLNACPGWTVGKYWWGYHGDDGGFYYQQDSSSELTSEKYGSGDIVGCGVDKHGGIFFTRNGKILGTI